jgi:hypothetical protein
MIREASKPIGHTRKSLLARWRRLLEEVRRLAEDIQDANGTLNWRERHNAEFALSRCEFHLTNEQPGGSDH